VGSSADLDAVEERKFLTLPGFEFRLLGFPVRSQLLYRLRYLGLIRKKKEEQKNNVDADVPDVLETSSCVVPWLT
jgi:hypothetical protein